MLTALHDTILALPTILVINHFGRAQAAPGLEQPGFDRLLDLLRSSKVYIKPSAPYQISQVDDYADFRESGQLVDCVPLEKMIDSG